jgi:hypothetical protein
MMWILRASASAVFLGLAGYLALAWLAERFVTARLDAAVQASSLAPKAVRER